MRLGSQKEDHETHSRSCEGPRTLFSELKEVCVLCMNMFVCTCIHVSVCIHAYVLCVYMCMFVYMCVCVKSLHLCPTLCGLMDCSPPGPSVHRILQARILEWVGTSFSSLCIIYVRSHVCICIYRYVYLHLYVCLCVYTCLCIIIWIYTYVRGGRGNPLQYSCLENPHGQRSLVDDGPQGHSESDVTQVN